jgi:DNA gyrase/topoisomerase IV subunit A
MVQKDKQNTPFIIGKGTFAQHTSRDMQPGASRYTEVKLSEMAQPVLIHIW